MLGGSVVEVPTEGVEHPSPAPVEERVAVFDNDGTLWCEKPMPIQLDFILRRLVEMAEADPELRDRQPWKAAYERDYGWLGTVLAEHYAGDDTNVRTLLGGVLAAHGGISVEEFEAKSDAFLRRRSIRRSAAATSRRLRADGRAARLPGGERVHELHRLGRRPRLHAADQPGGVRHSARAGDRQRPTFEYTSDDVAARSRTRPRPTTSTTARRSRSGSGAAPAAGRSSPPATRTATSRCSSSPSTRTSRSFACSSSTTTRARVRLHTAPNRHSNEPPKSAGPSQHQERLSGCVRRGTTVRMCRKSPLVSRGSRLADDGVTTRR